MGFSALPILTGDALERNERRYLSPDADEGVGGWRGVGGVRTVAWGRGLAGVERGMYLYVALHAQRWKESAAEQQALQPSLRDGCLLPAAVAAQRTSGGA